jgi:hypothetical protein
MAAEIWLTFPDMSRASFQLCGSLLSVGGGGGMGVAGLVGLADEMIG